ncbi:MAG: hypothetical protein DWQ35_16800 [Planctomycetota bacterium]|nr:MAG: hypothetical protein DWQ35_16800 [Planctomycetota bacterium]
MLFTAQHVISCDLDTQGQRVLESLNDPGSAFIPVYDAAILSSKGCASNTSLSTAIVSKHNLAFVLLPGDSHEAPEKRRYAYVAKQVFASCQIVLGHEIEGTMHVKGNPDAMNFIARESGDFFPVTDATVSTGEGTIHSVQVALVNKSFMSLLSIQDKKADAVSVAAELLRSLE